MKTNNREYAIRPVLIKDLDQLFTLLVDLVQHEGLAHRFKLTRERLEGELFGINADWNCLIAANPKDKLIGFCLYTFSNINRAFNLSPMIQIDDLYVTPEYRNAKVAYNLFQQLALIAKSKNIARFNVWCVKDNALGQNFYQQLGAEKRDFVDIYSIQVATLLANHLSIEKENTISLEKF